MSNPFIELLQSRGAEFRISPEKLSARMGAARGLLFDWDGVFNNTVKTSGGSPWGESDSMGLNMLRYAMWKRNKVLPPVYIITGAHNQTAIEFAERERFDGVFLNYKHKPEALKRIVKLTEIKPSAFAFFYDDILDLKVAAECGLRFAIRNDSAFALAEYIREHNLADYISAREGGNHALREIFELWLSLQGMYSEVVSDRLDFNESYEEYWLQRNKVQLEVFSPGKS